jgi:secreted trypsin-like serine protease
MDNDIMLLKLSSALQLNEYVSPVCLPDSSFKYDAGTQCITTGWGALTSAGLYPDLLQQVEVPIVGTDTCNAPNWYNGDITSTMICAGYEEGGKDSCQGDSGGPLVTHTGEHWVLPGIVSWGSGCAEKLRPGIYTKVTNYLQWIDDTMAAN